MFLSLTGVYNYNTDWYATLGTWPDICFAVQTVLWFNDKPGLANWEAIKRIFRYLIGMKDLWLGYRGQGRELVGYGHWWSRWKYGRRQKSSIQLCIHNQQQSSLLECKMTRNNFTIYDWKQICHCYIHSKRSTLALFIHSSTLQHHAQWNDTVFRQSVSHSPYQRTSVPHMHETHQHQIPFYLLGHRGW